MSGPNDTPIPAPAGPAEGGELTPVKRALLEIRQLRAELAGLRGAVRAPIAVVGMGLRLPGGVRDADGLARLLWSATDAVAGIPAERWSLEDFLDQDPDAPGRMTTRFGAFLEDVDRFDAEYFGISPREAATMDPQQRLLLEVAHHALEDAGLPAGRLAGSRTGVYVGMANGDYGRALFAHAEAIDTYFSTGNAFSVAAGRLSYLLGALGPAVVVDTACSSSLAALHLACQALRLGECDRALVGGVNLVLTPEMNISFSKARMMAADGRCKTFDAAADGYVRGEGCCVLVLRPLDQALAAGDRVLAVIRGSALNQDGRSSGLTAPSGPAQEAVIRAALEAAGVAPQAVGYVEAHGTGTPLGDPIEVGALAAALCAGRDPARPLRIGSIKTNIGHLEAAAGLAGVAKVIVALQRRELPPHLHFRQGNPHIDWSSPIAVPTAVEPWTPIDGRRLAGVSSFGFSGTNAHAVLEEAPPREAPPAGPPRGPHLLALSARDEVALAELARAYQEALAGGERVEDLCFTAAAGRTHHAARLSVVGQDAAALQRGLAAHLAGAPGPEVVAGRVEGGLRPQVAFLFTGQGAQCAGMGRALYEAEPVFRRTLDACAEVLAPRLPRGLLEVMFGAPGESPIDQTTWAQPATFALEVALAALWRSWGIEPVAVMGHSLGEYAAACVAGVFSLEDGIRLVAERGRANGALPPGGAMAAVFAPEEVVAQAVAQAGGAVAVAAYNGPAHQVVSGPEAAVEALTARLEQAGHQVKRLRVAHAAHSPLVEPALPALQRALQELRFGAPRLALVSNLTGAVAGPGELARPAYWLAHQREPVRFAQSIQALGALGITHFLEVGPHPVLVGMAAECLPGAGREWLPSLRRGQPDLAVMLEALQRLHAGGAEVDWEAFGRARGGRRVAAPRYPFRRRRHWAEFLGRPGPGAPGAEQRWAGVTAALDRQAERAPLDVQVAAYPEKWQALAELTTAHAQAFLREAGLFARAGERRTLPEVLRAAGVARTYQHLVARWLERVAARGALRRDGEAWVADAPLGDPGLPAAWAEAERRLADNAPLLAYVRRCGALLGRVLTGRESPLETLFPGGSFELAEGLYQRSATMRYVNELAAAGVAAFAAAQPPGCALRVLEVGAGTGGTTAALLPVLPAGRTQYTFTDVSDVFLDRARERFGAYPFLRHARLDLDADPAAQGFAPGSFDLVVASNSVHATRDLRESLERLRALLAPGGLLLLVESTVHHAWFDMTTGLVEGWQQFADDLRGDHPLLAPATWVRALEAAGFGAAGAWPRPGSAAEALGLHVLLARAPGEPAATAAAVEAPAGTAGEPAAAAPGPALPDLAERLREALPAERLELLRDFVRERVVRVLRLDPDQPPDRHARLMDLGFDSLMAVQLRNQLAAGIRLETALRRRCSSTTPPSTGWRRGSWSCWRRPRPPRPPRRRRRRGWGRRRWRP
ncbi:MAG: beta-ketoacyl synthase N-terminal-like domain-containing protein [Anaeromyxobacter sp.]